MESTLPCRKCGRALYGHRAGAKRNPHIRYYCPACGDGWNEPTLDEEIRGADLEIIKGSGESDPSGNTGGIPNSDGYP